MNKDTIFGSSTVRLPTKGRRSGCRRTGTAPSGESVAVGAARLSSSQTLTNLKRALDDLDHEAIDVQFIYPSFLLHANAWA